MILDYEAELNSAGGQLFNATDGNSEYGAKEYDLKATTPGDPAVGSRMDVTMQVVDDDCDVVTNYIVRIVAGATSGGGGSETVLLTKTILKAALTENSHHFIGTIPPGVGTMYRYIQSKVESTGSTPTTGKLIFHLHKPGAAPHNAATA
jgi:hypothetical protein